MFTSAGWKRQHGDKDMLSNWRSPPRPGAKSSSKVGRITGETGKSAEDERVAAGSVVAMKQSNVRGAKGPCHLQCLQQMAKRNDGAPGIDGVTFEAIEAQGVEALLEQLRDELIGRTYQPLPARRQEIPKDGGKVRVLSIPAIRDRVVQGALKLILEPVFEADFQPGSFGYR